MSELSLDALKNARNQLWYVELGAWLHNAGKLSEEFFRRFHDKNSFGWFIYQVVAGSFADKENFLNWLAAHPDKRFEDYRDGVPSVVES